MLDLLTITEQLHRVHGGTSEEDRALIHQASDAAALVRVTDACRLANAKGRKGASIPRWAGCLRTELAKQRKITGDAMTGLPE